MARGGLLALAMGGVALGAMTMDARADAPPAAAKAPIGDFMLADQNLLAKQLYRMADAKAVVIVTYAPGDAAVHAEAAGYKALQTAYAPKGVEFMMLDSHLGDRREAVLADAKAAGIDMPILFDYEQLVGEELGVTRTAEVIVVDPRTWTVAYRGPATGAAGEPWARKALDGLVAA
jgi:hypothetical protein